MDQNEILKRYRQLSGEKPKANNINENKQPTLANDVNKVVFIKEAKNGKTYAIVNQGLKYFVKESVSKQDLNINDFKFIGGEANARNYTYKNYDRAFNSLTSKIFTINEELSLGTGSIINESTECSECDKNKSEDIIVKKEEKDITEGVDFEIEDVNEEFEYKGEEFKVNPFAVCNKTVGSKEENPEKHEKCVQDVKASSKISESDISKITESAIYSDVLNVIADKLLKENFGREPIEEKITLAVPQTQENQPTNDGGNVDNQGDNDSELPFGKEKFDAKVDADESSDPKKFIEQLTGKLGQSLRKYNSENIDFDLEKYVLNSIISASHTSQMDPEDQQDIFSKIKGENKEEDEKPMEEPTEPAKEEGSDNVDKAPEVKEGVEDEDDMVFEWNDEDDKNDINEEETFEIED